MKIIMGSSFCIFLLAVILNSIELSLQSGIPRGPRISTPRGIRSGTPPFRKLRCPSDEQVTFETTFLLEDAGGSYVNCTPDKILLAIGPLIIGHILNNAIYPISGTFGGEITYNEFTNQLTVVSRGYLRENFGVFGPVPEETLHSNVIYPFGMFGPGRPRSPARPSSPTRPSSSTRPISPTISDSPERPSSPTIPSRPDTPDSPPMVISDFESIRGSSFDSDSVSSSTSSSSARSSFSRAFSNSSSRSGRPPSSTSGSPGKK